MARARFWCFLLGVSFAISCLGAETVYLSDGFQIEAQSHMLRDGDIIVQTGTGTLEFPQKLVARIARAQTIPVAPPAPVTLPELLRGAANSQGLEPELVRSVAKIESGLREGAVSPKGAVGLMQLMPDTAAQVGANPEQASSNAVGGAKYLRELLLRYRGNYVLALAAYNAGPGAIDKYHGVPPYAETVRYVDRVLREYELEKKQTHQQSAISKPKAEGKLITVVNTPSATD